MDSKGVTTFYGIGAFMTSYFVMLPDLELRAIHGWLYAKVLLGDIILSLLWPVYWGMWLAIEAT